MEEIQVMLARHGQHIQSLQHQINELKAVQAEIRAMNEALCTLANEIKHTNEHLARHEMKIEQIEAQPKARLNQIVTAIIAALSGGLISAGVAAVFALAY